jgi:hypothetical protein
LRLSILFNRTHIIHMTFSLTRRLKILCSIFKIRVFFITALLTQLYERVDISITRGKHLLESLSASFHKEWRLGLIKPPLFIEVHVSSQESGRLRIYVLGVLILSTFLRFFHWILEFFRHYSIIFHLRHAYQICPSLSDSMAIYIYWMNTHCTFQMKVHNPQWHFWIFFSLIANTFLWIHIYFHVYTFPFCEHVFVFMDI